MYQDVFAYWGPGVISVKESIKQKLFITKTLILFSMKINSILSNDETHMKPDKSLKGKLSQ